MSKLCKCPKCETIHPVSVIPDPTNDEVRNRISIYIDGGNMYHAAKKLGFKVDYIRLRDYFVSSNAELYHTYYYAAHDSSQGFIMKILDFLRHNGFVVVTKQVKKFPTMMKGNLDVELVIDMLVNREYYDTAILVSGDGDFTRCVKELQTSGKKVYVVSTEKTSPPLLAQELKNQADAFIELADIIPFVKQH